MKVSETTTKADRVALLEQPSGKGAYLAVKRLQDIVFSLLALVVLSPLLLGIALMVVIDDPHGGPFFSQERTGKGGKLFRMYKFRTMCVDAEKRLAELAQYNEREGPVFKIKNDPRITRVGGFLRRTSLDELPQLVNVLRGDMTIVGPRPALPAEVAQYTSEQLRRLEVTPGLTCFWQVHPDRYQLTMDEWLELDIKYIQERSWRLDWILIFKTVGTMLQASGE
ncbi:MAG: sugar transferase [Clostridiales bacterium]|nr:sugar transferase [Clostridiales bacterium]